MLYKRYIKTLSNVFCDVLETFLKRKFVSWVKALKATKRRSLPSGDKIMDNEALVVRTDKDGSLYFHDSDLW